jgi:hypothetical protein
VGGDFYSFGDKRKMTKEELEKEAEELIQRFEFANSMNCYMQLTPDRKQIGEMLIMIAEPREKRIEELEKELADAKEVQVIEHFEAYGQCRDSRRIADLERENAELKKEVELWKKASEDNSYKAFQLQEENKTLVQHILELQKDKGELVDRCRKLETQIEKMQEKLKADLIARLEEQIQYSTSPSCTKGMELFIKSIEKWEIREK